MAQHGLTRMDDEHIPHYSRMPYRQFVVWIWSRVTQDPGKSFQAGFQITVEMERTSVTTVYAGSIAGAFSTRAAAEETALKRAREWIDEQSAAA